MNVVGTGRLATVRAYPQLEPRVVSWLAELGAANMENMGDITTRFGSARPIGERQVEFALAEGLVIDTLVSFTGHTVMIRTARLLEADARS
jgi:hypothetical protein